MRLSHARCVASPSLICALVVADALLKMTHAHPRSNQVAPMMPLSDDMVLRRAVTYVHDAIHSRPIHHKANLLWLTRVVLSFAMMMVSFDDQTYHPRLRAQVDSTSLGFYSVYTNPSWRTLVGTRHRAWVGGKKGGGGWRGISPGRLDARLESNPPKPPRSRPLPSFLRCCRV